MGNICYNRKIKNKSAATATKHRTRKDAKLKIENDSVKQLANAGI